MGATATKTAKPRKATFVRETDDKGVSKFKPVNRHAKLAAALMGKKTASLEAKELKTVKAAGLRVYEYVDDKLKAITV